MQHVFVRGVARTAVAVDDEDYDRTLRFLARAVSRFELLCHAFCVLPNHAHFLLTSQHGNLSRAMHWLGTCTAQKFNHRYERSGHLFQGRFGSRLVKDERYFLELGRYIALNPVRAGLCHAPDAWAWSSYAATAGLCPAPRFLDTSELLATLGSQSAYVAWVADGLASSGLDEAGRPLPPPRPSLTEVLLDDSDRAVAVAHHQHGFSRAEIAAHLGVSRSQISRRLALHA